MKRTISRLARHLRSAVSRDRDRALVLVPLGHGMVDAWLVGHAKGERTLQVRRELSGVAWAELAAPHPLAARYLPPVVIATPARDTVTLQATLTIDRADPKARMNAGEFQEGLKKLQVQLWAEHRPRIAADLGVEPIDAVLVSFSVESVRVDGAEVIDPDDLLGARVELDVTVRFVGRDTFERAREAAAVPFFADPAWTIVAGHEPVAPALLLADADPAILIKADVGSDGMREAERVILPWSAGDVTRELEVRWAVSRAAAEAALSSHAEGVTFATTRIAVESAVRGPRDLLDRSLRAAKAPTPLPVISRVALPAGEGKGAVELVPLDPGRILRDTGLELGEGSYDPLVVAAFAEFYYNERYSRLNAWLRQRIAWLGTAGTL